MELEINELINKYRHKAKSQAKDLVKDQIHNYELVRVVLDAPGRQPNEFVAQLQKAMNVSNVPFRVTRHLDRNRIDRPQKRIVWAQHVAEAAQDLWEFSLDTTISADYNSLYESLTDIVAEQEHTHTKIEPKAILYLFSLELSETVMYKQALEETVRLANFAQTKALLKELVELIATERGVVEKKSVHERVIGGITGTQALIIQSLTRDSEPVVDDSEVTDSAEQERLSHENDDLRAAAEIAQHQLEALQEELEHIRHEAKQEAVITFFQEMNSAKNSHLLDQFQTAEALLKKLRQQGIEIPKEAELIPALITMFSRFLKTQGIRPKTLIGQTKEITLQESDEYEYVGSDFESNAERKTVQVQTGGWIFGETLISKPKATEIQE